MCLCVCVSVEEVSPVVGISGVQKRMDECTVKSFSNEHVCVTSLNAGLYGDRNLQ